ncbi:hypothetical protein [Legionella norrlandica]|nr:hypothetical protein [Legionella norrlandica]
MRCKNKYHIEQNNVCPEDIAVKIPRGLIEKTADYFNVEITPKG